MSGKFNNGWGVVQTGVVSSKNAPTTTTAQPNNWSAATVASPTTGNDILTSGTTAQPNNWSASTVATAGNSMATTAQPNRPATSPQQEARNAASSAWAGAVNNWNASNSLYAKTMSDLASYNGLDAHDRRNDAVRRYNSSNVDYQRAQLAYNKAKIDNPLASDAIYRDINNYGGGGYGDYVKKYGHIAAFYENGYGGKADLDNLAQAAFDADNKYRSTSWGDRDQKLAAHSESSAAKKALSKAIESLKQAWSQGEQNVGFSDGFNAVRGIR